MFRIRTVLATAAVAVLAGLGVAAPASAHDTIVSSSPGADEQLSAAPEEVALVFSNELLSLDGNTGTAMIVEDESGKDWVAGEPVVEADTVTVPLEPGMTDGTYLVTWKVVSSDGHPTSGDYSFSIAGVAPTEAPATETAEPEPTESATAVATQAEVTDEAEVPADDESAPWPLLIGLGVVLLAAVVTFIVILARKKR